MSGIMDLLREQLGGHVMAQISTALGTQNDTTKKAIGAALPVIVGALARNAKQPGGADDVSRAVQKDHDGSIFDNLSGFLRNAQRGPGGAILGHVLGARRDSVEHQVSRATGMPAPSTNRLMEMLAPMVMGALGQKRREQDLGSVGLAGLLDEESRHLERKPEARGVRSLLDRDGDGDIDLTDLANGMSGLFG